MHLNSLHLLNFKNHAEADLSFGSAVNCLLGANGVGKTNVLDAVHYLCLTKSYFNPIDGQNILHSADQMLVKGVFTRHNAQEEVALAVGRGAKKVVKRNGKPYQRLAEHIGRFPSVMIAPDDAALIHEGSERRRKWMDTVISQYDRAYLEALIDYNRAITQRNSLLRYFSENRSWSEEALRPWDERLAPSAALIYEARRAFSAEFVPAFGAVHATLVASSEDVGLTYHAPHAEDYSAALTAAREEDRRHRRTTVGPHKDDVHFLLGDHPLKRFGSQGQQKTFTIALRLAQLGYIERATGVKPVLLLDDIFDKIDDFRVQALMKRVAGEDFGQVFVTDTDDGRIPDMFRKSGANVRVFHVKRSGIEPELETTLYAKTAPNSAHQ